MNLDKFRREFPQLILRAKELEPLTNIWGTNSPLIQHTLNLAVSCVEEGEAYFEVGCLYGSSLAAACVNNEHVEKYAWDIEIQGQVSAIVNNPRNRIKFHQGDFFEDNSRYRLESLLTKPVSVYYYDANHDYSETVKALNKIEPFLADKSLILVDDIEYNRVYNALRDFVKQDTKYKHYTITHEFWTDDKFIALTKGRPYYHDGFCIIEYERQPERYDESVENIVISTWHATPPYEGFHNYVYPPQVKHLHNKPFMHISEWEKEQEDKR